VAPLYHEPFLAALPARHPLAGEAEVQPEALLTSGLLLLDEGHCLREQAMSLCRARPGAGAGADFRATSLETLRQIVAAGGGTTLLPALAVGEPDPRLAVRPLTGAPGRDIALIWRRNDPRAAAYQQLAGPIRKRLPDAVRRA
jgi:LysR family hydrogen peroxide-inducible transcriptional activator